MKKGILLVIALAVTLIAAACSPAPTPTPTQPPPPLPPTIQPRATATAVPPTATTAPPTATNAPPTVTPQATSSTAQATSAATAAPATATATSVPPTIAASPTPTLLAAPGLYVTNLSLSTPQLAHGQSTSFTVTFLNTATTVNNQRWAVYIYRADNPTRRIFETSTLQTAFQPGSVDLRAEGDFRYGASGNTCDYFFARVVTLDQNNKGIELTKPEGPVYDKGFAVCQ